MNSAVDTEVSTARAKELLEAIKATREFQRLKDISQLGAVAYVFKNATHTRDKHSEGVCELAGKLATHLRNECPQYNITDKDILCVQIAGLCYSLGHGPFSHFYFNRIKNGLIERKLVDESEIKLEDQVQTSCAILERILKSPEVNSKFENAGLCEADMKFIEALIKGKIENGLRPSEKDFLYEIVNNQYNYIDVKLWDYLGRDAVSLGDEVKREQEPIYSELLKTAIVMDVGNGTEKRSHIVYHHKAMTDICRLFSTKEMLYRKVYQHTDANAVEMMISDVLLETQLIRDSATGNIQKFLDLTDTTVMQQACEELQLMESKRGKKGLQLLERLNWKKKVYSPENWYRCNAENSTQMWKSRMPPAKRKNSYSASDGTMRDLIRHVENKLKGTQMKDRILVDIVEFKETFDPRKVWLYEKINNDYNPFTMDSVKQRVLVLENPQKFPPRLWKKGPYYDDETDTWFMTKESFKVDTMKLFEYKEYADCSIRLYAKDYSTLEDDSFPTWSAWDLPSKMFYALPIDDRCEELKLYPCRCLHEIRLWLSRVFWDQPKPDDKRNTCNRWLEHECASFMLKERLWYTTNRTEVVGMCAVVQGVLAWRASSSRRWVNAFRGALWTYVAGFASLWLYDCSQRNKQKLNIPDDKIKIVAGGIFVLSTATIAYAIPPDHTSADIYKPGKRAKFSWFKNMISSGSRLKNGQIKPWMTIDIHSRPIRALIGAAIGSLCLLGAEDLYLKLNISGLRVSEKS